MPRFLLALLTLGVGALAANAGPKLDTPPVAPTVTKPTASDLRAYATAAKRELRGDILPFWLEHARDRQRGGFYGRIGLDMKVYPDAPRGLLLSSRILWTFSAAYERFKAPEYLEMARWALPDLLERGWDAQHGGLYWTITPEGKPVDDHKYIYGEGFGVYGLVEYYRATHDQAALDRAITLYRLIEAKARDHAHGGYFESFRRDWTRDDVAGNHMLGGRGTKSQNTHIHILEAYTNLLRVWPDAKLRNDMRSLLEIMLTRIIDPKTHHLILYFNDDWTPVSDEISFGHDIELSWLVVEAAEVLGDPALLARAHATALQMAAVTEAQGVDADGGVLNEATPRGLSNVNKDWWPQAEAAVGFLNAYQLSGEPRYFADSRRTWQFIQAKCIDRKNGDWWESVTRDGTPRKFGNKLSVWKCPYHNSRSCLQIIERVEALTK